ncbi:hypothetical protein [Nostoc sp.]|uniref:hypothetical protein n=1 Tax=Nostoc sp. TaxID=1180 RepID=UPI002FFAB56B
MKYPLQTESKPVSGIAAKKLLEAIDSGGAVVNDRMLALAKRLATRNALKTCFVFKLVNKPIMRNLYKVLVISFTNKG